MPKLNPEMALALCSGSPSIYFSFPIDSIVILRPRHSCSTDASYISKSFPPCAWWRFLGSEQFRFLSEFFCLTGIFINSGMHIAQILEQRPFFLLFLYDNLRKWRNNSISIGQPNLGQNLLRILFFWSKKFFWPNLKS